MPIQRTLLERLRNPGPPGKRHVRVSMNDIVDSVLTNLQNVLNTCQGNCLTDEAYGLPHMTTIRSAMPGSVKGFEATIRKTIERHEPRLSGVRVRYSPSVDHGMALRFEISGLIHDEDGRETVRFETYADEQGRMRVR